MNTPTSEPEILYHYTDAKGLLGIIQGKKIWATSILHLNDSQEFIYLRDAAFEQARSRIAREGLSPGIENFILVGKTLQPSQFVFCLTENGDQLSQWRGYCARGEGYSIGFHRATLPRLFQQTASSLACCHYGLENDEARQLLSSITAKLVDGLRVASASREEHVRATTVITTLNDFVVDIAENARRFKHPGFAEEREWRMSFSPQVDKSLSVQFRATSFGLVPYVEVPFIEDKQSPIAEIVVGPSSNKALAELATKALIEKSGWGDVEIWSSTIPLRG